jgi:hypothetical protein
VLVGRAIDIVEVGVAILDIRLLQLDRKDRLRKIMIDNGKRFIVRCMFKFMAKIIPCIDTP